MKKKKKVDASTVILVVVLFAGLSLLLYPSVANYWNSMHATRIIAGYADTMSNLKDEEYERIWLEAAQYNQDLAAQGGSALTEEQRERYNRVLDIGGTGIMGYIEIESLDVTLPIYHGTSDGVLQIAVGHLDWTSLPVGGTSSHCVLSGHRGLPSAKLFTDLDKLHEGETFTLNVLDETLTYEVDQIRIVLPQETEDLVIVDGKDYCTLVTCTPYGINTHRLLVRGHRIETEKAAAHVVSEAVLIEPLIVAPVLAFPLLLILLLMVVFRKPKRREKTETEGHEAAETGEKPRKIRKHKSKRMKKEPRNYLRL